MPMRGIERAAPAILAKSFFSQIDVKQERLNLPPWDHGRQG